MAKITLSITTTQGSASLEIHDASNGSASSIFLGESFPDPLSITTSVEQNFAGGVTISGRQTDGLLIWQGVRALVSEDDRRMLKAIATKSDQGRQGDDTIAIRLDNEFYELVEDAASNSRAIASGGINTIGSTGSIWYYAAHNVYIDNYTVKRSNLQRNGNPAFEVEFDIIELHRLT